MTTIKHTYFLKLRTDSKVHFQCTYNVPESNEIIHLVSSSDIARNWCDIFRCASDGKQMWQQTADQNSMLANSPALTDTADGKMQNFVMHNIVGKIQNAKWEKLMCTQEVMYMHECLFACYSALSCTKIYEMFTGVFLISDLY